MSATQAMQLKTEKPTGAGIHIRVLFTNRNFIYKVGKIPVGEAHPI